MSRDRGTGRDPLRAYLIPVRPHIAAAALSQRRHTGPAVDIPAGVPELAMLTDPELETLTTLWKIVDRRATLAEEHGMVIARTSTARAPR